MADDTLRMTTAHIMNLQAAAFNMAITHLQAGWYLWLGRNRSNREDYAGALVCYERVLHFFPKHLRALANVGNCLHHQGRYTDAIDFYDRALQERSDYPDVHARLGLIFCRLQRYEESVDSLNRAFRMKPCLKEESGYCISLAFALAHLGKTEDALAAYKVAVENAPKNVEALAGLGWALWSGGKSKEAETPLKRAIQLDPNYAHAYDSLGRVLRDLGDDEESRLMWQRLIELKPEDCYSHASLGWALGGIGHYREAIAELENVLKMDPTFSVHYSIGLYHFYLKEYEKAIEAEEIAISQKADADAYCVIAASLLGQEKHERAIAACKQALDIDPESHLAWHNLGEAYWGTGHFEKAASCLEKALKIAPAIAESHLQLGIAFLKTGRSSEALNQCRLLRKMDGDKADELQSSISGSESVEIS